MKRSGGSAEIRVKMGHRLDVISIVDFSAENNYLTINKKPISLAYRKLAFCSASYLGYLQSNDINSYS